MLGGKSIEQDADALRTVLFSNPIGRLHVQQSALGSEVQRLETLATNDDPRESVYQNRVATTDASLTTLHTVPIPANTAVLIEAWVVARRTGGTAGAAEDSAFYIRQYGYKNVSGIATLVGLQGLDFTAEDQVTWDVTPTASGSNVLIQVVGAANNNITWHGTFRVWQLST